jgi:5-methylcytosine-specific restriction protein A
MKKKICNSPGCNRLIDHGSRYCDEHTRPPTIPFKNAVRTNGLLYNTTRWRKLRKIIIEESPFCSMCGATETELEVHHAIPPRGNEDLFFDKNNLVVVCSDCHRVVTNREIRKRKT